MRADELKKRQLGNLINIYIFAGFLKVYSVLSTLCYRKSWYALSGKKNKENV